MNGNSFRKDEIIMKEKIVKTNIIYALLYILVPVLLCALGLLITYFFFHDGGSGAVIFTMGPFLISAIWLIFGGGSIFKQEIKKFEAKLASDGFKRNQTFYGKGKYVAIDLEKGEIALLFFWNPFKAYIIPAGHIENAWVSDGRSGSGIMEGSQRVSFFFIVDGIKIRVDTFTSNQRQRMDSDYILTGISKADMMVKMLAQARANSKEV